MIDFTARLRSATNGGSVSLTIPRGLANDAGLKAGSFVIVSLTPAVLVPATAAAAAEAVEATDDDGDD